MPAASRAQMQVECEDLINTHKTKQHGENSAFVTTAFRGISLSHASITKPHPQKPSQVLPHSGVSKHKRVENVLCLVKSSWCLPVSGAVNAGSVFSL